MSVHKSETQMTPEEIIQALEITAMEITKERQEAGLPPVDGVALQREYKNKPISQNAKAFIENRTTYF